MAIYCLDILAIILTKEIKSKRILYAKVAIESFGLSIKDKAKRNKFWEYFTKYWLFSSEFIKMWNNHRVLDYKDFANSSL